MKASEFIENINEIISEHGDIEVLKESLNPVSVSYYFSEPLIDIEIVYTDLSGETTASMAVDACTRKVISIS